MARKRRDIAVLLDIGTARISIAVTKFGPGKSFEILAQIDSPSLGVRKGVIIDTRSVARIIENLMADAREKSNINLPERIYAVFSGTGIKVKDYHLQKDLGCRRHVSAGDVSKLLHKVNEQFNPEGLTQLHILPLQYSMDGHLVSSAEGKIGQNLEVDVRLVLAGKEPVQYIYDAVRLAGMRLRKVVFSPLVQSPLLVNGAETELGCILVDLGAETTTVSSFKYGTLRDALVLPVGMEHVVGDLAVGLRTTLKAAGELMQSFGLHSYQYEDSLVISIINARLEEIYELIKLSIQSMNFTGLIPGGVKLTGGGAMFPGMAEHLSQYLELQVLSIPPYVSVPGSDKCSVSLAGLAGYCCNYGIPGFLHAADGFESLSNNCGYTRRRMV